MIVDSDKWKDKRNRLSPRFLTRDKDADLRKQTALLETLGVIEKSTASEYSQYLDDVLVYATNDDELFERLRIVFERFRQFNITLNPKKCFFGLAEVEFVGHVLKSDGVCFSTEKGTKVLDFALPVKQKQLKSFLGLVNYFVQRPCTGSFPQSQTSQ
jgi:hypothetical protein